MIFLRGKALPHSICIARGKFRERVRLDSMAFASAVRQMTEQDLMRVAARFAELVNPGQWREMSDRQKGVVFLQGGTWAKAFLLEGFMVRKSPVKVMVENVD